MARVLRRGQGITLGEVQEVARGFIAFPFSPLGVEEDPQSVEDRRLLAEVGVAVCEGMCLPPELGVFLRSDTILPELAMRKFLEWEARLEACPE